jgi:hypothetical protein
MHIPCHETIFSGTNDRFLMELIGFPYDLYSTPGRDPHYPDPRRGEYAFKRSPLHVPLFLPCLRLTKNHAAPMAPRLFTFASRTIEQDDVDVPLPFFSTPA